MEADPFSFTFEKSPFAVPVITLDGGSAGRVVKRSDPLDLVAEARAVACAGSSEGVVSNPALTFRWSIDGQPDALSGLVGDSMINIPPYTLPVGQHTVLVVAVDDKGVSASASVDIEILPGEVKAHIQGGSRLMPTNIDFTLSATGSMDMNERGGSAAGLAYAWECATVTGSTCPGRVDSALTGETNTIPAGSISADVIYVFRVTVSSGGRSDTASAVVTGTDLNVPVVSIAGVPSRFNAGNKLALYGSASHNGVTSDSADDFTFQWVIVIGDLKMDDPIVLTQPSNPTLSVEAGGLMPGVLYTFRLYGAVDADSESGFSDASFYTNGAPTSGLFRAKAPDGSPMGEALRTVWTFKSDFWTDDTNGELLYQYAYIDKDGLEVILGPKRASAKMQTVLPQGSGTGNELKVVAYISDVDGAVTRVEERITVTPYIPDSAGQFDNEVLSMLNTDVVGAGSANDPTYAQSMIGALAETVNQAAKGGNSRAEVRSVMMNLLTESFNRQARSMSSVEQTAGVLSNVLGGFGEEYDIATLRSSTKLARDLIRAGAGKSAKASAAISEALSNILQGLSNRGSGRRNLLANDLQQNALSMEIFDLMHMLADDKADSMIAGERTQCSQTESYTVNVKVDHVKHAAPYHMASCEGVSSVHVPYNAYRNIGDTTEIMSTFVYFSANPFAWSDDSATIAGGMGFFSAADYKTRDALALSEMSPGIQYSVPLMTKKSNQRSADGAGETYECVAWDWNAQVWSNEGCHYVREPCSDEDTEMINTYGETEGRGWLHKICESSYAQGQCSQQCADLTKIVENCAALRMDNFYAGFEREYVDHMAMLGTNCDSYIEEVEHVTCECDQPTLVSVKVTPSGCDGVAGSNTGFDTCGVCGGDNSPATGMCDCEGVRGGSAKLDVCDVCNGDGSTCLDCAGTPNGYDKTCFGCDDLKNSGVENDACGVCGGDSTTCQGCDGVPNSGLYIDACGVCPSSLERVSICLGGCTNTELSRDFCGTCGGDNQACMGCDGIPNSGIEGDICGVCPGNSDGIPADGTTCDDCKGVPGGESIVDGCGICNGRDASMDACGVCNGDSSSCCDLDGDGKPDMDAKRDACGVCGGDDSSCTGCDGVIVPPPDTPLQLDGCGVCGGDGSVCADCAGVPYGTNSVDRCGRCLPADSADRQKSCAGCDGIVVPPPGQPAALDNCGLCGGNDDTCCDSDGDGVPEKNLSEDLCGVCGGDGASCTGCDGNATPPSVGKPKEVDACGVCGGDDSSCMGCDGVPNGQVLDGCGKCGGTNSTCAGCDGIPDSGKTYDDCGICGGQNQCEEIVDSPASITAATLIKTVVAAMAVIYAHF